MHTRETVLENEDANTLERKRRQRDLEQGEEERTQIVEVLRSWRTRLCTLSNTAELSHGKEYYLMFPANAEPAHVLPLLMPSHWFIIL